MRKAILVSLVAMGASPWCWAQFRVMTYNIHHGEGTDGKVDVERIAKVIETAHPDIVCLQEVDCNAARSGAVDVAKMLAERLGMTYAFGPNLRVDGGQYGNATLSRFEIVAQSNIRLPSAAGAEPRGCLKITVRVAGRSVKVLNVHLGLDATERNEQAAAILKLVGKAPTLVAGDFNEGTDGAAVKSLLERLRDSSLPGKTGPGSASGADTGTARIDLILASDGIDVLSSRVIAEGDAAVASDHRPCVADFGLRPAQETAADRGVYDYEDDERIREALTEGTE